MESSEKSATGELFSGAHRSDTAAIYVGGGNSVYRSIDGGENWTFYGSSVDNGSGDSWISVGVPSGKLDKIRTGQSVQQARGIPAGFSLRAEQGA